MEITDIYVAASKGGGVSAGYGTVTFDGILRVKFNIMKTKAEGRLFVNWPSQKGADGTYYPQVSFVIDEELENPYAEKNALEDTIIKEFNKTIGTSSTKDAKDEPKETPKEDTPPPKKSAGIKFGPRAKG